MNGLVISSYLKFIFIICIYSYHLKFCNNHDKWFSVKSATPGTDIWTYGCGSL